MEKLERAALEHRLSHINSRLEDALELLQSSINLTRQSCNLIAEVENEAEEICLSFDVPSDKA